MVVLPAVRRYARATQGSAALQRRQPLGVALMDLAAALQDRIELLELRLQECAQDLRRQERRADVDPGVLVDLTAEELLAVGALVADDLGPLDAARGR